MNLLLFGKDRIKRQAQKEANTYISRVTADGGIVQNEAFVQNYYEFLLRYFGYIPRRVYSSLGGVKLNNVLGLDYVQTWYDLNNTSPVDAVQGTAVSQPLWDTDTDIANRTLRFDGTNDTFTIDDLSIFTNQPIGNLWAVAKDTAPTISGVHSIIAVRTPTTSVRATIGTRGAVNNFRAGGRRLDTDTFNVAESANNGNFNTINGKLNWLGDVSTLTINKVDTATSEFSPSSDGNTDVTDSSVVEISGGGLFVGLISELHADRSVYTQTQINALHEFFKHYYPTLP